MASFLSSLSLLAEWHVLQTICCRLYAYSSMERKVAQGLELQGALDGGDWVRTLASPILMVGVCSKAASHRIIPTSWAVVGLAVGASHHCMPKRLTDVSKGSLKLIAGNTKSTRLGSAGRKATVGA